MKDVLDTMQYFYDGDWAFVNENIYKVINVLSEEEREEFNCDCKEIRWYDYISDFLKGTAIWALNED